MSGIDEFHKFRGDRIQESLKPEAKKTRSKKAPKLSVSKSELKEAIKTNETTEDGDVSQAVNNEIKNADTDGLLEKEGLVRHILTYQNDDKFGQLIKDRGLAHTHAQLKKMNNDKLAECLVQIKYAIGTRQNNRFIEENAVSAIKGVERLLHNRYCIDGLAATLDHDPEWKDTLHECLLQSGVYYIDPKIRLAMMTLQRANFIHSSHVLRKHVEQKQNSLESNLLFSGLSSAPPIQLPPIFEDSDASESRQEREDNVDTETSKKSKLTKTPKPTPQPSPRKPQMELPEISPREKQKDAEKQKNDAPKADPDALFPLFTLKQKEPKKSTNTKPSFLSNIALPKFFLDQ